MGLTYGGSIVDDSVVVKPAPITVPGEATLPSSGTWIEPSPSSSSVYIKRAEALPSKRCTPFGIAMRLWYKQPDGNKVRVLVQRYRFYSQLEDDLKTEICFLILSSGQI